MSTFSHVVMFVVISIALLLPMTTVATEYVVGDDSGWTTNFDYQNWAKDKQFYVGDTLVFKYQAGAHNVYKVNASSFASCTIPEPGTGLKSGHDVVTLAAPGKKWYICGVGRHCADLNQKLVINVQGWFAPAPAPNSAIKYGYQTFMAIVVIILAIITIN
ncbi:hypothetical protein QVD17_11514 [Tagetes erecta]|uniref:Phytocyanin domain-containing protein n=1 Tax=Tagetes erecta TaxID=13708 RepID=A0AAD8KXG7_TARER|nr:hypothetical protein QVD17_11514 [Tagetes erecta]